MRWCQRSHLASKQTQRGTIQMSRSTLTPKYATSMLKTRSARAINAVLDEIKAPPIMCADEERTAYLAFHSEDARLTGRSIGMCLTATSLLLAFSTFTLLTVNVRTRDDLAVVAALVACSLFVIALYLYVAMLVGRRVRNATAAAAVVQLRTASDRESSSTGSETKRSMSRALVRNRRRVGVRGRI